VFKQYPVAFHFVPKDFCSSGRKAAIFVVDNQSRFEKLEFHPGGVNVQQVSRRSNSVSARKLKLILKFS